MSLSMRGAGRSADDRGGVRPRPGPAAPRRLAGVPAQPARRRRLPHLARPAARCSPGAAPSTTGDRRPTASPSWQGSPASPRSGPGPRSTASSGPGSSPGPTRPSASPTRAGIGIRPGRRPLADSIGGGEGSLAIPRRILRLLAGGARPALIATVLGILLRCLSRGRGGFKSRGRVKASWIARVFDVDLRRVKQARKELIDLGWIAPEPTDQWAENRWGRAYTIDLAWDRIAAPDGRRLPPPPAAGGRRLPPPDSDPEPLREEKNQEPAPGGPAGFQIQETAEEQSPQPTSPDASGDRAPRSRRRRRRFWSLGRREDRAGLSTTGPGRDRGGDLAGPGRARATGPDSTGVGHGRGRGGTAAGADPERRAGRGPEGHRPAAGAAGPGDRPGPGGPERGGPAAVRGGGGARAGGGEGEPAGAVRVTWSGVGCGGT